MFRCLLFAFSLGIYSLTASVHGESENAAAAAAPTLPLAGLPQTWLQGEPVSEWQKDKVYILEFWATWCGPCLNAMPHMEQLHQKFAKEPLVQLIGINVMDRNKTEQQLKEFLAKRPVPLHYTMAADSDGRTVKEWLTPLNVQGIPHVLAVKNGQLIWRGHPQRLSTEMIADMIKPDFKPDSLLTADDPIARERTAKRRRMITEQTLELTRKQGADAALAFVDRLEKENQLKQNQLIHLKMQIAGALHHGKQTEQAQQLLDKLARQYPDNYRVQLDTVKLLLLQEPHARNAATARTIETCLNQSIKLAEKERPNDATPWELMAQFQEQQGNTQAAMHYLAAALERSPLAKAWAKYQELSGSKESFASLIEQVATTMQAITPVKQADWGEELQDKEYAPLLQQLTWLNHAPITGLPQDKTVWISFWRGGVHGQSVTEEPFPGAVLAAVLKQHQLTNDMHVCGIVLCYNPIDPSALSAAERTVWEQSPYPVGFAADDCVAELCRKLQIKDFPAVAIVRNGHLIWQGEIRRVPVWVIDAIKQNRLAPDQLTDAKLSYEKHQQEMYAVLQKHNSLRRNRQVEQALTLIEQNAERFADDPGFALTLAKTRAERAWNKQDYAQAVQAFDRVLSQFPREENQAAYIMKILNETEQFRPHSYHAVRKALQIMRDANTRANPEYNSACYESMMFKAMEQKDFVQARQDALNALKDLPLMQRYAELRRAK